MKNKAFTLIELLVVIAIIGILAGVVIASLNSAREKGRVASLKSTLKNLQTQAQLYHLDNGTFAGMCTYNTSGVTAHASIQPFIDSLTTLAGSENVRCIVRTSNVPHVLSFSATDSLETRNFGVAVYYNGTHYGVDTTGVITLDDTDSNGGATATWANSKDICPALGKRLPSVEILKAINDYGAQGGNLGFASGFYWSSTSMININNSAYSQSFGNGEVSRLAGTNLMRVRCAS